MEHFCFFNSAELQRLHFCVIMRGVVRHLVVSGYLSVCCFGISTSIGLSACPGATSIRPYIPHISRGHGGRMSVRHICVFEYIHWSINSSIVCQKLYNCRPIIPVDQHHCWSRAVSCMAGLGT